MSTGSVTVGEVDAGAGGISLTSTGALVTDALTDIGATFVTANGSSGTVTINGTSSDLSGLTINAGSTVEITGDVSSEDIQITSTGTLDTKVLTSDNRVILKSQGSGGDTTVDGTMTAADGIMHVTAGGKITITDDANVIADGDITLSAQDEIETKKLTSAQWVNVQTSSGSSADITLDGDILAQDGYVYVSSDGLINITGNVTSAADGHILLVAQKTLATGAINGASGFNIDLKANQNGDTSAFVTNDGTPTNGTSGIITSYGGAIYITNSTPGNAGDITVTNAGDLANNPAAGNRYIILNAQHGTLTMGGGMDISGDGTNPAGQIILMANTVNFADGAYFYSQEPMAGGSLHGISVNAETVTYGDSSGLTLDSDGTGNAVGAGYAYLLPEGATTITETGDVTDLFISGSSSLIAGDISYSGDGPLTVTANGNDEAVVVSGYPMSFSGGSITFQSQGNADNFVEVVNFGTLTGGPGLTFGGSGDVLIDASSFEGNGGSVTINVDQADISGNSFTVNASGAFTGDGDGGSALISSSALTLDDGTTATVMANAAGDGNGNASATAITFIPGAADFNVGTSPGQWSFSATGGLDSGDGGTIVLQGTDSAVTVFGADVSTPINVAAEGSTGNGGTINLTANNGLTFDGDASILNADSGFAGGNGGKILITTAVNPVVIGTGTAGDVTLSAISNIAGDGGTISVTSPAGITADSTYMAATSAGDGTGGNITLNAGSSDLTLNGDLDVSSDPAGNGQGGMISLTGGNIDLAEDANTGLYADGNGSGNGGSISVTTNTGDVTVSGDDAAFYLEAMSNGSADGGSVTINSAGDADLDGTYVTVSAGTSGGGTGGTISVTATGDITVTDEMNVTGGCDSGNGGNITLIGNVVTTADLNADAGGSSCMALASRNPDSRRPLTAGTGTAGIIIIESEDHIVETGSNLSANGTGNGVGGSITLEQTGSTTDMALNSANISASADYSGDADGGTIEITSAAGISMDSTVLAATASNTGSGTGGTVQITSYGAVDLNSTNIQAIGATDNGDGGHVIVTNSLGFSAGILNLAIKVDGGSSIDDTHFDGSIALNLVTCQQWKTSSPISGWPLTFWDCVHPDMPTDDEKSIALSAWTYITSAIVDDPGELGSSDNNVQIYAMQSVNDFELFFHGTSSTKNGILGATDGIQHVSAAFDHTIDDTSITEYYQGTILHELGHAWDNIEGLPSENGSLSFVDAVDSDVTAFNAMSCADAITATTGDSSWCSTYSPTWTNFQIYQIILAIQDPTAPAVATSYHEAWARAFAQEAQSSIATPDKNQPEFIQKVEDLMSNQKSYMETIFSTGTPY